MIINYKNKILINLVIFAVFLNLIMYFSSANIVSFPPYIAYIIIAIFVFIFYFFSKQNLYLNSYLVLWMSFYFLLISVHFILSPIGPEELKLYKKIVFFMLFLIVMQLLYGLDDDKLRITRKTIVVAAVICTILLGMDFFNPGIFVEAGRFVVIEGRASATYLNANPAGNAMNLMLILSIDVVPKKYRLPFIIIIFLGVFFTMSRSNILLFFIITSVMVYQRKINLKTAVLSYLGVLLLFTWLLFSGFDYLSKTFDLKVTDNMVSRINFFVDTKKSDTSDMSERKEVLGAALDMFKENPVFGGGFFATRFWDYKVAAHNTFATNWAEYGVLGLLIIPLLLFSVTYNIFRAKDKENKQVAILFIIHFVIASFFSHNQLEQEYQLAAVALISVLGLPSKKIRINTT